MSKTSSTIHIVGIYFLYGRSGRIRIPSRPCRNYILYFLVFFQTRDRNKLFITYVTLPNNPWSPSIFSRELKNECGKGKSPLTFLCMYGKTLVCGSMELTYLEKPPPKGLLEVERRFPV